VLSRGKHGFEVVNVALSSDAKKLATADAMGTLALSAVESGELEVLSSSLPLESNGLVGLAWDSVGRRLAVCAGTLIRIVDTESGSVRETQMGENVRAVAFAPDGARLVAAGRSLHFLNLADLRVAEKHDLTPNAPNAKITDIRFSPDGRLLGILMLGAAGFFDVESKQAEVAELRGINPVGLRFASDGRVAIFGRRALYVGPPIAKDAAQGAQATNGELWDVEFRKDGSLLFVGAAADAELAALLPP
jgi:hypothetical protein